MKVLFDRVIAALKRSENVVLCTILASSGSSPRGAGARMAVFSDGSTCGTVGGGEVERLAILEAGEVLEKGNTRLRAFCLAPEQIASIGMNCGGSVTIYYQLLTAAELQLINEIRHALDEDTNSWLYLQITNGKVTEFALVDEARAVSQPELFQKRAVLKNSEPVTYTEPLTRAGKVYLFGGGHVGQALVPVLAALDFKVVVYDNRRELADREHFPHAVNVIYGPYDNITPKVRLTKNDYVVIMTPAHQGDYAILEQVLRFETSYVGCIGSRNKIAKTQALLRQAGISEEAIASVHSPIGLPIKAETPAEIAISIAAQLIEHRANNR